MDKSIPILATLCMVAIVLGITFNIPLYITAEQNKQYIYVSEAVGVSMQPTLNTGDLLVIERKNATDFSLNVGDIVVFIYGNNIIAHRLIDIKNGLYYLKGDNGKNVQVVDDTAIIGKVIGVISRFNPVGKAFWEAVYGG